MNERIKELMLEAGYAAPELAGRANKLADLLIKECLNEVEFQYNGGREIDENTHSPDWNEAVECISAMIKLRFGIKNE